jgi:hypothetical protein
VINNRIQNNWDEAFYSMYGELRKSKFLTSVYKVQNRIYDNNLNSIVYIGDPKS